MTESQAKRIVRAVHPEADVTGTQCGVYTRYYIRNWQGRLCKNRPTEVTAWIAAAQNVQKEAKK